MTMTVLASFLVGALLPAVDHSATGMRAQQFDQPPAIVEQVRKKRGRSGRDRYRRDQYRTPAPGQQLRVRVSIPAAVVIGTVILLDSGERCVAQRQLEYGLWECVLE